MDVLDLARWQFGITTVYHFLMVPLTIGLSVLVAGLQTAWLRTGHRRWYLATRFWGKLLLVNFAAGVATGIVQEFQFGMTWNAYSRFVGDVFGAPLAMEGLVAFFVESVFLGLWIFGWDRLDRRVHLACAWAFALATVASAYFILAANSWMQHPVGVRFENGTPTLDSIGAVLTNSTALAAIPHTVAGAFAVSGAFLVGVAGWQLWRRGAHAEVWRSSLRLGGWVGVVAFAVLALTGDAQGKLMFEQQPMKMAAAEALCTTEAPASFSILAVGDVAGQDCAEVKTFTVPALLSFLAHGDFTTEVRGVDDLVTQYQAAYGSRYPDDPELGALAGRPIDYVPSLPVTYWGFRMMIGFGALSAGIGVLALWLTRGGRRPGSRWFPRLLAFGVVAPFLANSAGWIFTELGRQPFVVVPNPSGVDGVWMFTAQAVSRLSAGEVWTSLLTLTAVYLALGVAEVVVLRRYVRGGVDAALPPGDSAATSGKPLGDKGSEEDADAPLGFAY